MYQFMVTVEVKFQSPKVLEQPIRKMFSFRSFWKRQQEPLAGYFQNFGVNAVCLSDAEMLALGEVEGAGQFATISSSKQINIENVDGVITRNFKSADDPGIWYSSGRAYYPREKEC
jgi:hypothetical protein